MSPNRLSPFRGRAAAGTAVAALAAVPLVCLAWGSPPALGLALGVLTGGLALRLQGTGVEALARLAPARAERRARASSLARSALRTAALLVAHVRPELSFPWVAGGLFAVPLAVGLAAFAPGPHRRERRRTWTPS